MSEIKGFGYYFNPYNWGLGVNLYLEPDFPSLISISFLCVTIEINRWPYWKKYWS